MKFTLKTLITFSVAMVFIGTTTPAHAWGRKLNVQNLVGTYDYVATPDTSLACPETLTVTYDEETESLDSAIFHFDHIFSGNQSQANQGIETDPAHAAYYDHYSFVKVKAHSIVAEQGDHMTTSDLSNIPFPRGPLNAFPAGSEGSMHLQTFRRSQALEVSYNEKKGILKKSVIIDGSHFIDNCSYQRR